jgi:SAM-dependent methyltransferase
VLATDLSAEQIAEAAPHERITYRVAPAERSGLEPGSADLVSVAQALHWFDLDAFYPEVRRVLRPGGLFAAWTYGVLTVEGDAVGSVVSHFYHDVVGPHWPAGRRHVENGYAELAFPFKPVTSPPLTIRREWNLDELLGYVRSWSATSRMQRASGVDPVPALEQALAAEWGQRENRREVVWPIAMRAGRP